jgi:hypothetical protein
MFRIMNVSILIASAWLLPQALAVEADANAPETQPLRAQSRGTAPKLKPRPTYYLGSGTGGYMDNSSGGNTTPLSTFVLPANKYSQIAVEVEITADVSGDTQTMFALSVGDGVTADVNKSWIIKSMQNSHPQTTTLVKIMLPGGGKTARTITASGGVAYGTVGSSSLRATIVAVYGIK